MRNTVYLVVVMLVVIAMASLSIGCGVAVCEPGTKQACSCGTLDGLRLCKDDGSGFSICQCTGSSEKTGEQAGQEQSSEPAADASVADEPGPLEQTSDEVPADEPVADDAGPKEHGQDKDAPPANCNSDEFEFNGKCYTNEDFCKSQIQESGFPQFPQGSEAAMKQPYELEFDAVTKRPLFCKTKEGYYYLGGSGYGQCDIDGDGWINIEAYRALTSTDAAIKRNARCEMRKIRAIVYHAEGGKPQLQMLDKEVPLVETFRNDGGSKPTDLPVYTKDQAPLPKSNGQDCTDNSGCSAGEACYLGQCVAGRRFEPAEINTLTKGCVANLDLNDNKLDDASESPSDSPDPLNEFKPLLLAGYFVELHYGYYQKEYDDQGTKLNVYHIKERSRSVATGQQGLALNCQEKADAFQPDHWKRCQLRDNQRCADPNDPSKTRPGLSSCWLKDVQRLIPSLFKCVLYDNTTDKTTTSGYFHPDNYGFNKHYNRTICNAKGGLNSSDPTKQDVEFSCTKDDGTRAPDPSKKEVGWACVSFQSYSKKEEYLGSCIDETAEQVCGTTKDGKPVTYFQLERDSYGLTRAGAQCGASQGVGQCDSAVRICTGGKWLDCNKCDNCPQNTAGQKALCPNGVWSTGTCKLLQGPTPETCDGIDNDCDGAVDEGLPTITYYKDNDGDTYGDPQTAIKACLGRGPTGHVLRAGDCNDNDAQIKPNTTDECDGVDNDCDGSIDEDAAVPVTTRWYKDNDGDGYGDKADTGFTGCKGGDATKGFVICPAGAACVPFTYTDNGQTREYVRENTDCCDKDKDVNPGQTGYPTSPSSACSTSGKSFWDYNCDGSDTPDPTIKLCQCSTRSYFRETKHAYCDFSCKSSTVTWKEDTSCKSSTKYPCSHASTNSLYACQLDKTHIFEVTTSYTGGCTKCCGGSCGAFGNGAINLTCDKSELSGINASKYTPKSSDGSSDLIALAKSQFGNAGTCHFLLNGKVPKCGETTNTINKGSTESAPSYSPADKEVCSTSTTQCLADKYTASCSYQHTIQYSTDYYYFKTSSIGNGKVVGCH